MNNYLEDIKVKSALKSEEMKLDYRKKNNPKEISEERCSLNCFSAC